MRLLKIASFLLVFAPTTALCENFEIIETVYSADKKIKADYLKSDNIKHNGWKIKILEDSKIPEFRFIRPQNRKFIDGKFFSDTGELTLIFQGDLKFEYFLRKIKPQKSGFCVFTKWHFYPMVLESDNYHSIADSLNFEIISPQKVRVSRKNSPKQNTSTFIFGRGTIELNGSSHPNSHEQMRIDGNWSGNIKRHSPLIHSYKTTRYCYKKDDALNAEKLSHFEISFRNPEFPMLKIESSTGDTHFNTAKIFENKYAKVILWGNESLFYCFYSLENNEWVFKNIFAIKIPNTTIPKLRDHPKNKSIYEAFLFVDNADSIYVNFGKLRNKEQNLPNPILFKITQNGEIFCNDKMLTRAGFIENTIKDGGKTVPFYEVELEFN